MPKSIPIMIKGFVGCPSINSDKKNFSQHNLNRSMNTNFKIPIANRQKSSECNAMLCNLRDTFCSFLHISSPALPLSLLPIKKRGELFSLISPGSLLLKFFRMATETARPKWKPVGKPWVVECLPRKFVT